MSAKILISGASGLVGSHLTKQLVASGYQVSHLSRTATGKEKVSTFQWNLKTMTIDAEAVDVDYIIHLAGAGVADHKWTSSRKQEILDSRVNSTKLLYNTVKERGVRLKGFISASAIGLYGLNTGDKLVDEDAPQANDFLAGVVKHWEQEANSFESLDIPVTKIRIGVVLANEGGALPKMKKPIELGVGAPLGSGKQFMSWIHYRDLCRIFQWAIEEHKPGIYNAVAPIPVTNQQLTRAIAKRIRRPLLLPNVPSFVLKMMLGEMSGIVLGGNNVSSKKLVDSGFNFEFQDLETALRDLLK